MDRSVRTMNKLIIDSILGNCVVSSYKFLQFLFGKLVLLKPELPHELTLQLNFQKILFWTSLVVQHLTLCLPMQWVQVQSLVGETEIPGLTAEKQNIKQKQYCNRFNKDFRNGPHQKNLKRFCLSVPLTVLKSFVKSIISKR